MNETVSSILNRTNATLAQKLDALTDEEWADLTDALTASMTKQIDARGLVLVRKSVIDDLRAALRWVLPYVRSSAYGTPAYIRAVELATPATADRD